MAGVALAAGLWLGDSTLRLETAAIYPDVLPRLKKAVWGIGNALSFLAVLVIVLAGPVTQRSDLIAPLIVMPVYGALMAFVVRPRGAKAEPFYDPAPALWPGRWARWTGPGQILLMILPPLIFLWPVVVDGTPRRTAFVLFGLCLGLSAVLPLHAALPRRRRGADRVWRVVRGGLVVGAVVWLVLAFAQGHAG